MSECVEEKLCLDEAARRLLAELARKYSPVSETEISEENREG